MKLNKKLSALLAMLVLVCMTTIGVYAAGKVSASDYEVIVRTDKETYSEGEKVQISFDVINKSDIEAKSVEMKYNIPEIIKPNVENLDKLPAKVENLEARKAIVYNGKVVEIKKLDSNDKPVLDNGDKNDKNDKIDGEKPKTGDSSNAILYVVVASVAVGALFVMGYKKDALKKSAYLFMAAVLFVGTLGQTNMNAMAAAYNFDVSGSITVTYAGKPYKITVIATVNVEEVSDTTEKPSDTSKDETTETKTEATTEATTETPGTETPTEAPTDKPSGDNTGDSSTGTEIVPGSDFDRVTVHDPSIVKDPKTGTYYIFGSHMAWAKSDDLINWETFTNNINTDYKKLFAEGAEWSALGGNQGNASYDVGGNLWAPDVIWNESMQKWCMYMSVNGDYWYTSVALLTADNIEGPYEYVGTVVYSGFTKTEEAAKTDFAKVTGTNVVPDRYLASRNNDHTYGMNAIDPNVFYDEDGKLWMVYGSWFGGLYMLRLDSDTGLRDYTYTYKTVANESDEYQGIKIAGGENCSGEAPYIEKIGDYYWLFTSYGGLKAKGGYNMRVFRSENVTGPYTDLSGDDARYTAGTNNINGKVGIKIFGNYQWSFMKYGQVAQGHNSVLTDDDGKVYVVYHTRTTDGTEGHSVRVHQLFVNEDGWLVAAPYEYTGETLSETAYDKAKLTGTYEVLYHKQSVNYSQLECVTAQKLTLNADGTVSGDYTGTWTADTDSANVTMVLGGVTYKGVFVEQYIEESAYKTMTFTMLGSNEVEFWGSKYLTGKDAVDFTISSEAVVLPEKTVDNISFVTEGLYGTVITYSSSNTDVIANDGTVTRKDKNVDVTLTVTYKNGNYSVDKQYVVKVLKETDEKLLVGEYYTDNALDISKAAEGTYSYENPFNSKVTNGLVIYNGVSIEFDVEGTGGYLSNILSFYGSGRMYFTGGSYLGYNATGGYFDANVDNKNWVAGTDYIKGKAKIRIEITAAGFEVYANDKLAYSSKDLEAGNIKGSIDSAFEGYSSVLKWLNNTAETINFGWGSWWNENFKGTISNVKLYVNPIDKVDTSGYVYYQDYSKGDITEWTSTNAQDSLTLANDGNNYGNYLKFIFPSGASGSRGAISQFKLDSTVTGKYTVEMDVKLTAGKDNKESQFAIMGEDYAYLSKNINYGLDSGYILKLSTTNSTVWNIAGTSSTVTIPKDTWVTIKAKVNTDSATADIEILNGDTTLYTGTVDISGSGKLKGIYVLNGRNSSVTCVDNIKVKENADDTTTGGDEGTKDDETTSVKPIYLYDFATGLESTGKVTGSTTTATIVGSGSLVQDEVRGQVFDNNTGVISTIRENYLSLPGTIGHAISSFASKELTVSMWIKSPVKNNGVTDAYGFYSPLFAMKDAEGTDAWPLLNIGLRGTSQVNWGGFIDNNVNEDITYLNDNAWHHVAATFSSTGTTVYVDGVVKNTAVNTTDNTCVGIFGAAEGTWDSVNIGGNNIWGWYDIDSHLYFDDVAIYDKALSESEIGEIINPSSK